MCCSVRSNKLDNNTTLSGTDAEAETPRLFAAALLDWAPSDCAVDSSAGPTHIAFKRDDDRPIYPVSPDLSGSANVSPSALISPGK